MIVPKAPNRSRGSLRRTTLTRTSSLNLISPSMEHSTSSSTGVYRSSTMSPIFVVDPRLRQLKPDARPLENPDPRIFSSAADCRLTVFQTLEEAQKVWIKGDEFTIPVLLHGPSTSHNRHTAEVAEQNPPYTIDPAGCSLAIFRLAPADYHRFHSPIAGELIHGPVEIPGTYYTVNPQAVTEVDFDVFTGNKRQTIYIKEEVTGKIIAFVAIGALLVGSIGWSKQKGDKITRGEELGWFAYGGSTVITVFPAAMVQFDEDLRTNSASALETYVKVSEILFSRDSANVLRLGRIQLGPSSLISKERP